jgi:DNA-binding CsgD family transcriptional regulator
VRHAPAGSELAAGPTPLAGVGSGQRSQPATAGDLVAEAGRLLAAPALVVVAGGPGAGRSTALRQLADAFHGPVFAGGGLAMLRSSPAFALARAVRVRLPAHDPALLAEAVRSRVRAGLLVVDDLQWADPATLGALPLLAAHCRVAVTLRTPHRLPADAERALREAAAGWLALPPLTADEARSLVRRTAPGLDEASVCAVLARAGGVPLALQALARHAHLGPPAGGDGPDQTAYALAQALADLGRAARTALAALGLLGRPATAALLGPGVEELAAAGLVTVAPNGPAADPVSPDGGPIPVPVQVPVQVPVRVPVRVPVQVAPVSPYLAEVAAGLLDTPARAALHRRLADLVPPGEAARHLAAAGDAPAAYTRAVAAAANAGSTGERADLLLLACQLPGAQPPPAVRLDAARAALACGRARAAAEVLRLEPDPAAAVLRGEALLQLGEADAARQAVAAVPDDAPPPQVAGRDRVLLLASGTADRYDQIVARHGDQPAHPGLRAALAAVGAARRASGWEHRLASAAAAAAGAGDLLTARWSAWLLVETLAGDGRLAEAAQTARAAAAACAVDLAYSWQTRFLAAELWCTALRGAAAEPGGEDVLRRAGDLVDRALPVSALGYAAAAASLVEADGGLLAPARARLATVPAEPGTAGAVVDWVAREAAWLDGQPEHATAAGPPGAAPLVDGLRRITAHWAAYDRCGDAGAGRDAGADAGAEEVGVGDPLVATETGRSGVAPAPVRETLAAWAGDPGRFARAAEAWHDLAIREEVRCLLAQGLRHTDPAQAVPPLLAAELLAEQAGLVVLLGRARRGLRLHGVRRHARDAGHLHEQAAELTGRERDVLRLVARGEPTRRIAGQLGISGETVETHIRSGMRKLGARTRTEAAALALEILR